MPVLRPGWPLTGLYVGFPLWWALGASQLAFLAAAAVMALQLARRPHLVVPSGFGLWLLFLVWVGVGVALVWAQPPGTVPVSGLGPLAAFAYRAAWYLAATVAMLYVLNLTETELPARRVSRLLGYMFVVTVAFGLAAVVAPRFEFPSPLELVLPSQLTGQRWVYELIHPALAEQSQFLGYTQPRPTAPFTYANAWGNNLALFAPFFVLTWLGRDGAWRRPVAPVVLVAALVPITFSLNRGLWLVLGLAGLYAAARLAVNGHTRSLRLLLVGAVTTGVFLLTTPLYQTVAVRLETPHSNQRRVDTASQVLSTTWHGSPVAGYGGTRQMEGSFASLAGGSTPECPQCAAPPLGTQGFLWRLVFTTGYVGTVLCMGFLLLQFWRSRSGDRPYAIVGCTALLAGMLLFGVYDSLGSPVFTLMLAIGLMTRERMATGGAGSRAVARAGGAS